MTMILLHGLPPACTASEGISGARILYSSSIMKVLVALHLTPMREDTRALTLAGPVRAAHLE